MSHLNPPAYSKGVVNDCNIIESGIKHEPPECPDYSICAVKDWNIIKSGIKHESAAPLCLQQRSGKWLKQYWKWQKTWASWTPVPKAQVQWMTETLLKVAINMSLLNPPAYNTCVVNDWNNIESGINHETLEPPCTQQKCGKWLNIVSDIKHETPEPPCLQQRCGKWLKQYWKCHKTWASWTHCLQQRIGKWLKHYSKWHKSWASWSSYLQQRSGKWLKQYWKWHKTRAPWMPWLQHKRSKRLKHY
jgi:hypothetical protein